MHCFNFVLDIFPTSYITLRVFQMITEIRLSICDCHFCIWPSFFFFLSLFCLQHVISTLHMPKCIRSITFRTADFCVLLLRIIWYVPCSDGSLQAYPYVENGSGIPQFTAEILYSKSLTQTIFCEYIDI